MAPRQVTIEARTAYPETVASARVRVVNFAPWLSPHGVRLAFRSMLTPEEYAVINAASAGRKAWVITRALGRTIRTVPRAPVFVHRMCLLSAAPFIDPPRTVAAYDFDDALFVGSIGRANRAYSSLKQEPEKWRRYVSRARVVIAGNQYLAEHASRFATNVVVIPSCVAPSVSVDRPPHDRPLTFGWIGSSSTSPYLTPALAAFARFRLEQPQARLLLIGAGRRPKTAGVNHRPWTLEGEAAALGEMDVGMMPVPDTPWTRGKCGYKLLQYFNSGIPAIASPVGVNAHLIEDGRGISADSEDEWLRAFRAMTAERGQLVERGARAREFVAKNYSYARWAPELARCLIDAVDDL